MLLPESWLKYCSARSHFFACWRKIIPDPAAELMKSKTIQIISCIDPF